MAEKSTCAAKKCRIVEDFHASHVTPGPDNEVKVAESDSLEKTEHVETRCGLSTYRPSLLQKCNNPQVLCCCLCVYTLIYGFAVNGINNVNTTSYERRFELSSSTVGWISSSFDISAAICGVVIGFYGNKRNKGQILTIAFIVSSLGSMFMCMPHFLTSKYDWGQGQSHLCTKSMPVSKCTDTDSGLSHYLGLLILGQLMHGVGGSTLITVGYSFIDDSVPSASSPMYISMIGLCQMLGPMIGFLVGGMFLDLYVDFEKIPRSEWKVAPTDPRWVGAWWVGYFISSMLMFLFALPFLLFGAELPSAKDVRKNRVPETHDDGTPTTTKLGETISIRQFPVILVRLLRNPAFMCVAFAGAFIGLISVSLATFLPKYIQNIYGATASGAAAYAGLIAIPGAAIGQTFGGFVIRRWELKVRSILKFLIVMVLLAIVFNTCFFINCDILVWNTNNSSTLSSETVANTCNEDCHCDESVYVVVCDSNAKIYYSPCRAGCIKDTGINTYSDCKCVPFASNITSVSGENCITSTCNSFLYIFLFMIFMSAFVLSGSTVPALTVVLRCAHESERTFALGMLNFIARVIDDGTTRTNEDWGITRTYEDEGTTRTYEDEGTTRTNEDKGTTRTYKDEGITKTNEDEDTTRTNKNEGTTRNNEDEGTTRTSEEDSLTRTNEDEGTTRTNEEDGITRTTEDEGTTRANEDDGTTRTNKDEGTTRNNEDEGTTRTNEEDGITRTNEEDSTTRTNKDKGTTRANEDEGTTRTNIDEGTTRNNEDEGTTRANEDKGTAGINKDEGTKTDDIAFSCTIPGPILYGVVIDSTCDMWGKKCGYQTSCWNYSNAKMGQHLALLGIIFTSIAAFFFCTAYKLYKLPVGRKKEPLVDSNYVNMKVLDVAGGMYALSNIIELDDTGL